MTIIEAINKLDAIKPNVYPQEEKVEWLSTLDGMIKRDVIDTHKGGEDISFDGYDVNTPLTQKLLVDAPYDDIYVLYMESRIDYHNAEYVKYNNSITRYNDVYQAYANDYNRRHMPCGKKIRYY